MTGKITLGMIGVVLILSVYNTVQISKIEREPKTILQEGIKMTYDWFKSNYKNLRL